MNPYILIVGTIYTALFVVLASTSDGSAQTAPLVPPPAVEQTVNPLVYCHSQGGEMKDGKCVKRERKQ